MNRSAGAISMGAGVVGPDRTEGGESKAPGEASGAPAAIHARMTSFCTGVSAPCGESVGGISSPWTSIHSSDSVGRRGITISGFAAIRRRSRTYPNRPLGFAKSGPWQPAHLVAKTPRTSPPISRTGGLGCAFAIPAPNPANTARDTAAASHDFFIFFIAHRPSRGK
jgi:hypothetical protein